MHELERDRLMAWLRTTDLYDMAKSLTWEAFLQSESEASYSSKSAMKTVIEAAMLAAGQQEIILNAVQQMIESDILHGQSYVTNTSSISRYAGDEPISCIMQTREMWEEGIDNELKAMASESKRKLVRLRNVDMKNPHLVDNNDQDVIHSDLPSSGLNAAHIIRHGEADYVKFLYDSEDLFETILIIRNPNMKAEASDRWLGMIKLPIQVPSLADTVAQFAELSPAVSQFGLDENYVKDSHRYCASWHEVTEAVACAGNTVDARRLLRRGVVPSVRPSIWRLALGLETSSTPAEAHTYDSLCQSCHRLDLTTDDLFIFDVQTVLDDPKFFVFEEELKAVALCFNRDSWVQQHSAYSIHKLLNDADLTIINHVDSVTQKEVATISGVHPFAGLAAYNGPMCYLYRNPVSLYAVCRSAYAKLWCRLNVISGDHGTMMTLCRAFESLLMEACPSLFLHLLRIGLQPLAVAFPWMHQAFIYLLEIDQLLLLWDRLLGYMDIHLLAVLAAAIFCAKSDSLFQCTSAIEANLILQETSRLCVIPLLQLFLFSEEGRS